MNSRLDDITNAKEQVRLRADIAAVVGRYVGLKSRGHEMVGLCPFHKEKTGSFYVNPSKGVFHCYGCGKGGDVFRFVQDIEGVDFIEALEMLAEETGVKLPERRLGRGDNGGDGRYDGGDYDDRYYDQYSGHPSSSPSSTGKPQKSSTKNVLLAIHEEAAKFFYKHVKDNRQVIEYFKSRGLKAETVKEFGLGYAPAGWSALLDHLRGKGFSQSQIVESGLAVAKDNGSVYDRFRDRVIFPLYDLSGRVVAFAGRGMDADAQPKYLNSPETPLYQKSRILYGLHKARESIRDKGSLLIVEGYMDHLTLFQSGIRNVAAVSGTAFTEDHARIIKRFAKKIALVFDGDRAGLAAAQRAAFVLAPFSLQVSILALPTGDDPDSFVKRDGPDAFLALLSSKSRSAEDFLIDKCAAEQDGTPHARSRAVDELMPYARALTDPIVRDDFLDRLAKRLRVDRKRVAERFGAAAADSRVSSAGMPPASAHYPNLPQNTPVLGALEESFLRILLTLPELVVSAKQYILPEMLTDELSTNIYSIILDAHTQNGGAGGIMDAVAGDPVKEGAVSMLIARPARLENIHGEFTQKILLLRQKYYKARMAVLTEELGRCSENDKGRLLEEIRDCGERLNEELKELDARE